MISETKQLQTMLTFDSEEEKQEYKASLDRIANILEETYQDLRGRTWQNEKGQLQVLKQIEADRGTVKRLRKYLDE